MTASSFYNAGATVYSETNPAPADAVTEANAAATSAAGAAASASAAAASASAASASAAALGAAGTGFFAITAAGPTVATRSFTTTSGEIVITNPAGIAGNPDFSLAASQPNDHTWAATQNFTGALQIGGTRIDDAWLQTTPTPSTVGGALTTASAIVRYKQVGKSVKIQGSVSITTKGASASGAVLCPLPITGATVLTAQYIGGRDAVTGKGLTGMLTAADPNNVRLVYTDATSPAADGISLVFGGEYEVP